MDRDANRREAEVILLYAGTQALKGLIRNSVAQWTGHNLTVAWESFARSLGPLSRADGFPNDLLTAGTEGLSGFEPLKSASERRS